MNCLCCGKPIKDNAEPMGHQLCWHKVCIKKFFGTTEMPHIDISAEALYELAQQSTNKGYTVPGVQKKLSLHLTKEKNPRLTLVNYPTGYILKPQTEEYDALPEAEHLVMNMAKATGISTVPFALLKTADNGFAYITKRIDRVTADKRGSNIRMLAMEDFCQLDGRLTTDKYSGSYERCAKIVAKYSDKPGLDNAELFLRILFSYAVGNSDMHLKNFSLVENENDTGKYSLSDAYDMLPVNVILPADTEEMALTLNGKKKKLRKKDFMVFAENIGLQPKVAERLIKKVVSFEERYIEMCKNSYLPDDMKESLCKLILDRIEKIR